MNFQKENALNIEQIDREYQNLEQCNTEFAQQLHAFAVKLHDAAARDENSQALYNDLKAIAQTYHQEQQQMTTLLQAIHAAVQKNDAQAGVDRNDPRSNFAHQLHHSGFGQAIVRGIGFGIGDDLIRKIL